MKFVGDPLRRQRLSSAGKKKGQGARTSKQPTLSDQNNTKKKRSGNQAAKISRRVAFAKTYLDTYVTDSQSIHVPASRARAPVLLPSRDISSCIVELFFAFLVVLCTTSRRPSWHGRLEARSLNDTRCSCAEWERPNAEPPLFHVREVERMRGVSEPHGPWPAFTGLGFRALHESTPRECGCQDSSLGESTPAIPDSSRAE